MRIVEMTVDPIALHRDAFVADLHCDAVLQMQRGYDLSERHDEYHVDIPRLREGGVDLQVFATTVNSHNLSETPFDQVCRQLTLLRDTSDRFADDLALCRNSGDVHAAREAGQIAMVLGLEGGHALQQSVANVERLYTRGVRLITIVHEAPTGWAVGWNDEKSDIKGLNDLGREMILEMNHLGIIIDLSHSSSATMDAVCETSRRPVIASHSPAFALSDHGRNVADEQARKIGSTGGMIGVGFISWFLSPEYARASKEFWANHRNEEELLMRLFVSESDEPERVRQLERLRPLLDRAEQHYGRFRPTVATVVDHIDYLAKLIGIDHVGLGSDFDGMTGPPVGLEDCSKFPNFTRELAARGYAEAAIRKILGENFLRVFQQVCG